MKHRSDRDNTADGGSERSDDDHVAGSSSGHGRSIDSGVAAVIVAGGRGTRLAPFTFVLPKPLIPLGNVPVVEIMIARFATFGIGKVIFSLGHMAEIVIAYIAGIRERFPRMEFEFVREPSPLGTAGSLQLVDDLVGDTFIVSNGDILTDIDYGDLLRFHDEKRAMLTVASFVKKGQLDLGVIVCEDDVIVDYLEKPAYEHRVSMGIYVFSASALSYIKPDERVDFNDLLLRLVNAKERVVAYPFAGTWFDIGKPDDYAKAQEVFLEDTTRYFPSESELPT